MAAPPSKPATQAPAPETANKKPPKERLVPLLPGDRTETHALIAEGQRLTLSLWGERRYVICTSCDTSAPGFQKKTTAPRALELIMSKDLTTVSFDVLDAAVLKEKPAVVSITLKDGMAHVQAGAGLVYDSDPTEEYLETLNKAGAPLAALRLAEKGLE
jgi:hypothetical protein